MEIFHHNYSTASLELSIAVPGFSSSPSSDGESAVLASSETRESSGGAMKELDINQVPSPIEEEEECMEEEEEEENDSPNNNGVGVGAASAPRKKLRLTKEQSRLLEETFLQNHTLNPKEKEALAVELKLKARQVEVWFQNRRARSKMKQTEMECEYLKRWFGTLIEQNRRLQKEVEELRAIKVASHPPPPPHTMCPRCDRVITTTTPLLEKGPASGASTATTTTTSTNKMHAISSTPHYVL